MQALCKAVRKQSLCGSKPGGAEAYNLRESCVKKDRFAANAAATNTKALTKKIKDLLNFYKNEIKKIRNRLADIADLDHKLPPNYKPGQDSDILHTFMKRAKASQDMTVRARIKAAIDKKNATLRAQLTFTHGIEILVLNAALDHYTVAVADIAK
jgi:hypothetical protein